MRTILPDQSVDARVTRELEREHQERTLHDEARAGLGAEEDCRSKDARESAHSTNLKRSHG
jgi:hypothetical protein